MDLYGSASRVFVVLFGLNTRLRPLGAPWLRRPAPDGAPSVGLCRSGLTADWFASAAVALAVGRRARSCSYPRSPARRFVPEARKSVTTASVVCCCTAASDRIRAARKRYGLCPRNALGLVRWSTPGPPDRGPCHRASQTCVLVHIHACIPAQTFGRRTPNSAR